MDEPERCCFDDWVDHWSRRSTRRSTVAGVTRPLLGALDDAGLRGRTVLDVGCGIGDLAIETVARGAAFAHGFDLSGKAIGEATRLAARRGVDDRTSFQVGDGATVPLPASDVVVLNRVFCCYPDIDALLERSVAAAGSVYAFTAPPSSGILGAIARIQTRVSNIGYRMRDRRYQGFRVFVHDLAAVDQRLRGAGFRRARWERRRLAWQLGVYVRAASEDVPTGDVAVASGS